MTRRKNLILLRLSLHYKEPLFFLCVKWKTEPHSSFVLLIELQRFFWVSKSKKEVAKRHLEFFCYSLHNFINFSITWQIEQKKKRKKQWNLDAIWYIVFLFLFHLSVPFCFEPFCPVIISLCCTNNLIFPTNEPC